jgi:hypothetical protein
MAPVTFYDFTHLPGYPSTFALPLKDGKALHCIKFDEDAERGYGYTVTLVTEGKEAEVFTGYYDGFGMEDRPFDVIHAIREYLRVNGLQS